MHGLNQHTEVVAERLAQYLVQLPNITLTPYCVPKLRLDHAKGRLNIRPDTVGELQSMVFQ